MNEIPNSISACASVAVSENKEWQKALTRWTIEMLILTKSRPKLLETLRI